MTEQEQNNVNQEGTAPAPFGRLMTHILIGAAISGVASSIPVLNILNCCFCLLNMGGVVLAMHLYLGSHPADRLSFGEAAGFGALAGAGAGLITGLIGFAVGMLFKQATASQFSQLPPEAAQIISFLQGAQLAMVPVQMAIYAVFGLLGAVLGLQLFFKGRIRR